jgi:beta-N-acetylhexosaminidase
MAGQMIMVGFIGTSSTSSGFRRLIDHLKEGIIGGVLFLPRNIVGRAELQQMVDEVRQCKSPEVPLIAIDEEGGTVDWLGKEAGFDDVASAAKVGEGSDDYARQQYGALAKKLADVGFNMNMAPVVDLNRNPHNPIIAARGRSFSSDPAVVERYARIFIAEHHARGILTALKHFPGHGSSSSDTHVAAADVGTSWSEDELAPYRSLLASDMVDAIMVGHLVNRRRWGGVATQQGSTAISGILRGELKFDGVVISDDLTMDAVREGRDRFSEVVASAIDAGVDLALVVHPVTGEADDTGLAINTGVVEAVRAGRIARSTVESSYQRILALKARLERLRRDRQ